MVVTLMVVTRPLGGSEGQPLVVECESLDSVPRSSRRYGIRSATRFPPIGTSVQIAGPVYALATTESVMCRSPALAG